MSVNIKVTGGLNIEWGQIDPKATGGLRQDISHLKINKYKINIKHRHQWLKSEQVSCKRVFLVPPAALSGAAEWGAEYGADGGNRYGGKSCSSACSSWF